LAIQQSLPVEIRPHVGAALAVGGAVASRCVLARSSIAFEAVAPRAEFLERLKKRCFTWLVEGSAVKDAFLTDSDHPSPLDRCAWVQSAP
jgi:hypothetical protein